MVNKSWVLNRPTWTDSHTSVAFVILFKNLLSKLHVRGMLHWPYFSRFLYF